MAWRDWDWTALGVVLAFFIALGSGFMFLTGEIHASEVRVTNRINNVETALKADLGKRIDKVEESIEAMRTAYNDRQLVIENRLAKLEAVRSHRAID